MKRETTPPVGETKEGCRHSRLVDDVRDQDSRPTGQLRCRECGEVIPDPKKSP